MHVEKLEQARVNEALGRERISNVKVAQAATLVRQAGFAEEAVVACPGPDPGHRWRDRVGVSRRIARSDVANDGPGGVAARPAGAALAAGTEAATAARRRRPVRLPPTVMPTASTTGHNGHDRHVQLPRAGARAHVQWRERRRRTAIGTRERSASSAATLRDCAAEWPPIWRSKRHRSGTDPVLLIDADARRRRVTKRFHINGSPGWREVLAGRGRRGELHPSTRSRQPGGDVAGSTERS